ATDFRRDELPDRHGGLDPPRHTSSLQKWPEGDRGRTLGSQPVWRQSSIDRIRLSMPRGPATQYARLLPPLPSRIERCGLHEPIGRRRNNRGPISQLFSQIAPSRAVLTENWSPSAASSRPRKPSAQETHPPTPTTTRFHLAERNPAKAHASPFPLARMISI